jgi:hypothetical protein
MSVASLLWRVKNPLKAASEVLNPCDMPLSHSLTEKLGLCRGETRNKTPSLTRIFVSICQKHRQGDNNAEAAGSDVTAGFASLSFNGAQIEIQQVLLTTCDQSITHAKRTSSLFETLSNWGKETEVAGKEATTGHGTDHLNSTLLDSWMEQFASLAGPLFGAFLNQGHAEHS